VPGQTPMTSVTPTAWAARTSVTTCRALGRDDRIGRVTDPVVAKSSTPVSRSQVTGWLLGVRSEWTQQGAGARINPEPRVLPPRQQRSRRHGRHPSQSLDRSGGPVDRVQRHAPVRGRAAVQADLAHRRDGLRQVPRQPSGQATRPSTDVSPSIHSCTAHVHPPPARHW